MPSPDPVAAARAFLDQIGDTRSAKTRTVVQATRVLDVYFRTHGYVLDRWGNYRFPNAEAPLKYTIAARVLQKFTKGANGWIKVSSEPILDAAQRLVARAAERSGDAEVVKAALLARATRRDEGDRAAEKRARVRIRERAQSELRKQAMAEFRDRGLLPLLAADPVAARAHPDVVARMASLESEEIFAMDAISAKIRLNNGEMPDVDDGERFSLDAPPWAWIDAQLYAWTEDDHSVRIDGTERDTPYLIGASDLGFHPLQFRMEWKDRFAGGVGEGWIGGGITFLPRPPKDLGDAPVVVVRITTVSAKVKGSGAGRRLVARAARLARGYARASGGPAILSVERIVDEGRGFWDRLEETGDLIRIGKADKQDGFRFYRIGTILEAPRKTLTLSDLLPKRKP